VGAANYPEFMKVHTEYLTFNTRDRYEMVHITPQIEAIVRKSGVDDGLCFVSPMHITAAIYVNDNESGLIEDIGKWLEKLATPTTSTTRPAKTTATPTSKPSSSTTKQRCQSPTAGSTWAPGSASSTRNSTVSAPSASSSKFSAKGKINHFR